MLDSEKIFKNCKYYMKNFYLKSKKLSGKIFYFFYRYFDKYRYQLPIPTKLSCIPNNIHEKTNKNINNQTKIFLRLQQKKIIITQTDNSNLVSHITDAY